jgi:hypothetical protein
MFVYCNGKISVLGAARCGSSSLYNYFNLEYHSQDNETIDHWKWYGEFGMRKVIILRNPYDRVASALNIINYAEKMDVDPTEFFAIHSCPYMWQLRELEFQIIDFYELDMYVGISESSIVTNTHTDSAFNYIPNTLYSAQQLKQEYIDYVTILNSRHKLTVDQWKYMTQ